LGSGDIKTKFTHHQTLFLGRSCCGEGCGKDGIDQKLNNDLQLLAIIIGTTRRLMGENLLWHIIYKLAQQIIN
jgi:hypothetical protein